MAVDARQQHRHLVAKSDGHGLLQVAAPGHRRVAVFLGEIGKRVRDSVEILLHQHECGADLQNRGGVRDVLRRGAPMAPFAEPVAAEPHQLLHHRQDGIADPLGLHLEARHVDLFGVAMAADLVGGLGGNDAEPRLDPGERRLDVEITLHARPVREHVAHRCGPEQVAEHLGIDRGGGHGGSFGGRIQTVPTSRTSTSVRP